MKEYIRTKDDKIFDLEKIKNELKIKSAYPHLKDWKLEPTNDQRGALRLSWIAYFNEGEAKVSGYENNRECAAILDCESSEYQEADTIEELCDVFVLETEGKIITYDKAYFTCFSEDWYHNYLKAFDYGTMLGHEISVNGYGAIHIKDKGLIYVAKMNEKGELELL